MGLLGTRRLSRLPTKPRSISSHERRWFAGATHSHAAGSPRVTAHGVYLLLRGSAGASPSRLLGERVGNVGNEGLVGIRGRWLIADELGLNGVVGADNQALRGNANHDDRLLRLDRHPFADGVVG